MPRKTLLLALAAAALLLTAGCSSLTRPDEIRIFAEAPSTEPLSAAAAAGTLPAARPGPRAPGARAPGG